MPPPIATLVFALGITGLFLLDCEGRIRDSKALCLPFVWLWISSSRSLGEWLAILQTGRLPTIDRALSYAEGSPLDRNVLMVLMAIAWFVICNRGRLGALLRANIPIVVFLLYGGISALWSDFPDITIRRWFRAVGCVLMMMVVLSDRNREVAMRRVLVWGGFTLIPISVLLIKYYPAIGRSWVIESISNWVVMPTGVTSHKNILGEICQIYGVVFVWHFFVALRDRQLEHRGRHLIAHGVALAMVAWLFIQANSVTAQSCFLLATVLLVVTNIPAVARKRWMVHAVFFALVIIPFGALFMGIGSGVIESMGRNSTLTGRIDIWPRVIALVHNPLLGTGFESFWLGDRLETMERYQKSLNEAHNGYVEIYATLGWIGVFILLTLIVTGYRNIIAVYRRNQSAGSLRLAIFLTAIVSNFTEASMRTSSLCWVSLLLVTLAASKASDSPRKAAAPSIKRGIHRARPEPELEWSPIVRGGSF